MRAASDRLRWVGAAAILVVGAIHVHYRESSYRLPIVIAIIAEVIAIAMLAAYLASSRRPEPAVGATEH